MLAFLNLGPLEVVVILVVAVLIFGKDLPQAASKAYMQFRKMRGALDDLRRDSGIEREMRNIERTVREAEWEARRAGQPKKGEAGWRAALPPEAGGPPALEEAGQPQGEATPGAVEREAPGKKPDGLPETDAPTDSAS